MITKFKILSTISFIALAIVLTFVGVWALSDLDFTVGGNITYTAPKPKIDLKQDENGFYVTMGTYNNADVIWRLVGLDGERYTSTSAPTSGTGTFILETTACSAITSKFNASLGDGNDYATSLIRTYLKGDYVTVLNLTNDITYKAIAPRSVSELYQNMAWRTDDAGEVENCTLPTGTYDTTEDSLWLMSVAEIYTLVGGGKITNNTIDPIWDVDWGNSIWNDTNYWLRTPFPVNPLSAFHVLGDGDVLNNLVGVAYAVRPAFNLVF